MKPIRSMLCLAAIAAALACGAAGALDYPTRVVRIIVPYPPGGSADAQARIVADALQKQMGQPVVIENKPGAGTTIGAAAAANARPDGYTLYMAPGSFTIAPYLHKSAGYDPVTSFVAVSQVSTSYFLLLVAPASGIDSLAALIARAKQQPGKLTFASQGIGGGPHLSGELFRSQAGIDIVHVPFTGAPASFNAVIGGHVDFVVGDVTAIPLVRGDQLRALAVTSPERSPMLPDVPTFAEAGVKGVEFTNWGAIVAPAGTPTDILDYLNRAVVSALEKPEVRQGFERLGFSVLTSTREALQARIVNEYTLSGDIIKRAGLGAP